MTPIRKLAAFFLPASAMSLSVFGLAAGSLAETHDDEVGTATAMQCDISISKDRYGHRYAGILTAAKTVSGYYELDLTQRGGTQAMISQAGAFHVRAGETRTLGQAIFGGSRPQDVEARLVLHIDGQTFICGTEAEI